MRLISPLHSRLLALNVLLVLSAGLIADGCKRSAPAAPGSDGSGSQGQSTPGSSPSSSSGSSNGSPGSRPDDHPGSLADRLKAVEDQAAHAGDDPSKAPARPLPDWKAVSGSTSGMEIPQIPTLLVDSVIYSDTGDLEDFNEITSMDATTITKRAENEKAPTTPGGHPVDLNGHDNGIGKGTIVLNKADWASSNHLEPFFQPNGTVQHAGITDRGVSTETLRQLRAGKLVDFQIVTTLGGMLTDVFKMRVPPETLQWTDLQVFQCNLQRVEPTDLSVPMLVNNEPVELPALHARCTMSNKDQDDFYILDQLPNPIFLYTRINTNGDSSQTIKITFSSSQKQLVPGNAMEQKLADKKPVEIYGIYFDFNSAFIKPQSEAVLKQIADILQKNPTWKLSVAGHTDNIGDAAFNLKLSQARAAAVKTALVKEYKIDPDRLSTSGYGAANSIADNTKPEGRARNRRVELQRQ